MLRTFALNGLYFTFFSSKRFSFAALACHTAAVQRQPIH